VTNTRSVGRAQHPRYCSHPSTQELRRKRKHLESEGAGCCAAAFWRAEWIDLGSFSIVSNSHMASDRSRGQRAVAVIRTARANDYACPYLLEERLRRGASDLPGPPRSGPASAQSQDTVRKGTGHAGASDRTLSSAQQPFNDVAALTRACAQLAALPACAH
jgi:hypothetical protein